MSGTKKAGLFYATRDGQAVRIAQRLSERLAKSGIAAVPQDLKVDFPDTRKIKDIGVIIVIASIRYGFHLPEATRLLRKYKEACEQDTKASACKLVIVSVNLTARKKGKDTATGNVYLRKWIARHEIKPALAVPIAGRLDYPKYNWFDKFMIRLIMTITKGPTDTTQVVEFTQWDRVDKLADDITRIM